MFKYNLLKCTQLILSSMDSDEVNSISDTTEALQVVDILETTYVDIASTLDFPDHWDFFELEPSLDVTRPTLMSLPDDVATLEWIQYDHTLSTETGRDYRAVTPMDRVHFLERMNGLDTVDSNIYQYEHQVGTGTFDVRGYNDKEPVYYTTNNDRTIIFDNFRLSEGQTLQGNRTHCYGMRIPPFIRADSFIPDFEPRQFSLFFNEAKSQAFLELKQVENGKAEQRARKGWVQAHRKSPQTAAGAIKKDWTPNFGRRR